EALPDDDPDHRAEGRMGIRQPGGGETLEPDEGEDLVEDAVGRIEYVDPELRDDHEGEDRRYEIDRAHAAREALADVGEDGGQRECRRILDEYRDRHQDEGVEQ